MNISKQNTHNLVFFILLWKHPGGLKAFVVILVPVAFCRDMEAADCSGRVSLKCSVLFVEFGQLSVWFLFCINFYNVLIEACLHSLNLFYLLLLLYLCILSKNFTFSFCFVYSKVEGQCQICKNTVNITINNGSLDGIGLV